MPRFEQCLNGVQFANGNRPVVTSRLRGFFFIIALRNSRDMKQKRIEFDHVPLARTNLSFHVIGIQLLVKLFCRYNF